MFAEVAPDQYLYHYTSLETALVRIIPTGKLRAGPLSKVNDPREYSDWRLGATIDLEIPGEDISTEEFFELSRIVNGVRKRLKVVCFALDEPSAAAMNPPDYEFGRGYAHSRMWDQYADRHRGVCLIFDRVMIESAFTRQCKEQEMPVRCAQVSYSNWSREHMDAFQVKWSRVHRLGAEGAVREHWEQWMSVLAFTKSLEWSSENEHRILVEGTEEGTALLRIRRRACRNCPWICIRR